MDPNEEILPSGRISRETGRSEGYTGQFAQVAARAVPSPHIATRMSQNGHAGKLEWINGALVEYEVPLTRYAQRITGDTERARDVVQETFLRLCREQPPLVDGRLAQWLFTVCRNQALDVRRKESRMTTLAEPQKIASNPGGPEQPGPHEAAAARDESERVLRLVAELPESQGEAIRLRFEGGLSYAEIAEITGSTRGSVGLLIHRGLCTLRQRLKQSK
jgi:RNA polymerase sigma-70 factor (ECF subfamily)